MTTKVSSLDECTSSPFLGQISASHRLTGGNTPKGRQLSAELKALETEIFYDYPKEGGIRNIKSIKLREQYSDLRTSMPYNREKYIARLYELRDLKNKIMELEGVTP